MSKEKQQQIEALGRLGWSLRRIEREAQVRRETASRYLKAAGIDVRGRGGGPAKPATSPGVITDLGGDADSNAATLSGVITDPADNAGARGPAPPARSESLCEPYRALIERWVDDGRTGMSVWQALVDQHGFVGRYAAVQRFVRGLRRVHTPEARVVMATRPGEGIGNFRRKLRRVARAERGWQVARCRGAGDLKPSDH